MKKASGLNGSEAHSFTIYLQLFSGNLLTNPMGYVIIYTVRTKEVMRMKQRKKRLRQRAKALADKVIKFTAEILAATISGLITAAIMRLLGW
jgi:hypothetical protein